MLGGCFVFLLAFELCVAVEIRYDAGPFANVLADLWFQSYSCENKNLDFVNDKSDPLFYVGNIENVDDRWKFEVPLAVGIKMPVYNLPNLDKVALKLSNANLSAIFAGEITRWDDENLASQNPGISFPDEQIVTVRTEEDETSENRSILMPEFESDVASLVASIPFSVGMVHVAESQKRNLQTALTEAPNGNFVTVEQLYETIKRPDAIEIFPHSAEVIHIYVKESYLDADCETIAEFYRSLHWLQSQDALFRKLWMVPLKTEVQDFLPVYIDCGVKRLMIIEPPSDGIPIDTSSSATISFGLNIVFIAITFFAFILVTKVYTEQKRFVYSQWFMDVDNPVGPGVEESPEEETKKEAPGSENQMATEFAEMTFLAANQWPFYRGLCANWQGKSVTMFHSSVMKHPSKFSNTTSYKLSRLSRMVQHRNVQSLLGLTVLEADGLIPVECTGLYHIYGNECMSSLHILLQTCKAKLTNTVMHALALDICSGIRYLHGHGIMHGMLNSWNCMVDRNWVVSIANWAQCHLCSYEKQHELFFKAQDKLEKVTEAHLAKRLLYQHPDVVRGKVSLLEIEPRHDYHSLAMVFTEIFTRKPPYHTMVANEQGWGQILIDVVKSNKDPTLPLSVPLDVRSLIRELRSPTKQTDLGNAENVLLEGAGFSDNVGLINKLLEQKEKEETDGAERTVSANSRFDSAGKGFGAARFRNAANAFKSKARWAFNARTPLRSYGDIYIG